MFGSPLATGPFAMYGAIPLSLPVPPWIAYASVEVDWNNDGDFSDANEDLAENVIGLEYVVGRDYASQLIGRSVAGSLKVSLFNTQGIYSPSNPASPLYGLLLPNRKVRVRSAGEVLWTGFLDGPPKLSVSQGSLPRASLSAKGPLALLANPNLKINPPAMRDAYTGDIINAILDAANWPALARDIDRGDVQIGHWFVQNKGALQALQEIEEVEGGFLHEGTNWDIVFKSRYARFLETRSLVSQASYSDAPGASLTYREIEQDDPLRTIFNRIEVTVTPYIDGDLAVLWTLNQPLVIAPLSSVTIIAQYNGAYVWDWVTPVVGTDLIQSGVPNADITVTTVEKAKSLEITIANNNAVANSQVISLQARGYPVTAGDDLSIVREDATSQANYQLRTYPFDSPWTPNIPWAEGNAEYTLAEYKDPHPVMGIGFPAGVNPTLWWDTIHRKLADRVTLKADGTQTYLGVDQDFYIETISHKLDRKAFWQTSLLLSPAKANPDYWQLDVDQLDVGTRLAY